MVMLGFAIGFVATLAGLAAFMGLLGTCSRLQHDERHPRARSAAADLSPGIGPRS